MYLFTTLSVYLGLVLVGASPQAFSQAHLAQNSPANCFETHSKTNSTLSKLKFRVSTKENEVVPFSVFRDSNKSTTDEAAKSCLRNFAGLYAQVKNENNQVLITSNFPRASL